MSRKVKIILCSLGGFIFFLYILTGCITYYCIFNTKIDWLAFEKKFSYLASFFSNPNVPVEQQKENKDKPKEELDEITTIINKSYNDYNLSYKENVEWVNKI